MNSPQYSALLPTEWMKVGCEQEQVKGRVLTEQVMSVFCNTQASNQHSYTLVSLGRMPDTRFLGHDKIILLNAQRELIRQ